MMVLKYHVQKLMHVAIGILVLVCCIPFDFILMQGITVLIEY